MANDLYDKLMERLLEGRNSEENYKTVKDSLWQIVQSDTDRYLKMFFHNWFNNNWTKPLRAYQPRKTPTPKQIKERRIQDTNLRAVALMNTFLSDGETRLKDATGNQVRNEAGWLQLIARHVKPNEIVGKKLTAQQL